MLDHKSLLPQVSKLLPQYSEKEIMEGIKEFEQAHPDLNEQQAMQALTMALAQQKQAAPQGKPFENLVSQVGGK